MPSSHGTLHAGEQGTPLSKRNQLKSMRASSFSFIHPQTCMHAHENHLYLRWRGTCINLFRKRQGMAGQLLYAYLRIESFCNFCCIFPFCAVSLCQMLTFQSGSSGLYPPQLFSRNLKHCFLKIKERRTDNEIITAFPSPFWGRQKGNKTGFPKFSLSPGQQQGRQLASTAHSA